MKRAVVATAVSLSCINQHVQVPNYPHRSMRVEIPSEAPVPRVVAPYVPSDQAMIKASMDLAKCGVNDTVLDIGCGDGSICIYAKHVCGVSKAIGWEIDVGLLSMAREIVGTEQGFDFKWVDCMDPDTLQLLTQLCEEGDMVIYLFLMPDGIKFLQETLIQCMKDNSGLRVITRRFAFQQDLMAPAQVDEANELYLYTGCT